MSTDCMGSVQSDMDFSLFTARTAEKSTVLKLKFRFLQMVTLYDLTYVTL